MSVYVLQGNIWGPFMSMELETGQHAYSPNPELMQNLSSHCYITTLLGVNILSSFSWLRHIRVCRSVSTALFFLVDVFIRFCHIAMRYWMGYCSCRWALGATHRLTLTLILTLIGHSVPPIKPAITGACTMMVMSILDISPVVLI